MGSRHLLGPADDIASGSMKGYDVAGRRVLVARQGDSYYGLNARCPHLGGDLSRGRLEGHEVICPRHGSRFDVRDGSVVEWTEALPGAVKSVSRVLKKPTPALVYPVSVEGGRLYVELQE